MRSDKDSIARLRQEGMSYKEIEQTMNIPRSTLSHWFHGKDWSSKIEARLREKAITTSTTRIIELNKARGKKLTELYERAREEAREDFKVLKYNPLFISGIMLYWGEGDKVTKHSVRMTNTDPEMMRLYVRFLEIFSGLSRRKIRVSILVYPDLDESACKEFWSERIGLSKEHFIKSTLIKGRHKTNRLPYGICIVTVSSSYLKEKMREWMRLLPQELMAV